MSEGIILAILSIFGASIAAGFKFYSESKLARQKFESEIISKALEHKEEKERAKHFKFLLEVGLINSLDKNGVKKLANDPSRIPRAISFRDLIPNSAVSGTIKVTEPAVWRNWTEEEGQYGYSMVSRTYNSGRVLAVGHEGFLISFDTQYKKDVLKKAFDWVCGSSSPRSIRFSKGHCEWIPTQNIIESQHLYTALKNNWGYDVKEIQDLIEDENLKNVGVLVIGNAWGSFTESEIESIKNFVSNGGGLFVAGLGWSWLSYSSQKGFKCDGKMQGQDIKDLSTYPMNRVVKPFGMRWTDKTLN